MLKHKYNDIRSRVKSPVRVEGRIVGHIQDNCFLKRVKGSCHQLRAPKAWCISKKAFYELILPNAELIIVEDVESGRCYKCATEIFAKCSFEIQRAHLNLS